MKWPLLHITISAKELCQALVRELLGSCLLIVMGCGSVLAAQFGNPQTFNITGASLCWGITVATLALSLQCHMNPAVTIALASIGQISIPTGALYIVTQCAGTTLGAQILVGLTPKNFTWALGATQLNSVSQLQGFGMEIISTFLLLLVISGANDKTRNAQQGSAPLAIGLCVTALILFCGPFTGASMNPARSFGPSLITGNWKNHWLYWAGPIIGAVAGVVCYHFLFQSSEKSDIRQEEIIKTGNNDQNKKMQSIGGENNPSFA
ncbi:aquaporin AQPAe.a [Folsomia candida]|uniref:aquaporin AQPAe.a n=1 Tax=Folsomia candida TaxID=158441 RepID=UPI000B9084A5|nr:aquaporin AQPAe.a [Folsomia candida]